MSDPQLYFSFNGVNKLSMSSAHCTRWALRLDQALRMAALGSILAGILVMVAAAIDIGSISMFAAILSGAIIGGMFGALLLLLLSITFLLGVRLLAVLLGSRTRAQWAIAASRHTSMVVGNRAGAEGCGWGADGGG